MPNQNTYKHGSNNVLCDVCGFKYKAEDTRERWDGLRVCDKDWEPRHPMDFFRAKEDDPSVPNPSFSDGEDGGVDINGNVFPVINSTVYDYTFDDPDKWDIVAALPPLSSGTNVSGGKLNVGIPITTTPGISFVTPSVALVPTIGESYSYNIVIDSFTSATSASIILGGSTLWDKDDGAGTFSGTIEATTNQELLIGSTNAYYIVDEITITQL